jgi:hypothetical protein
MKSHLLSLVLGVAGVASMCGCQKPNIYTVRSITYETISGRLDAQWFERDISGTNGARSAVELVYCPIVPSGPMVCRTAVVWRKDQTALMDSK